MLSWVALVEDPASKDRHSAGSFDRLFAKDKIRKLMHCLDIPVGIPPSSVSLKKVADQNNLADGIEVVTWIRNALIHPKRQHRNDVQAVGGDALVAASQLSLWFLELALLALMGYRGLYSDRFKSKWAEERFQVPWAQGV